MPESAPGDGGLVWGGSAPGVGGGVWSGGSAWSGGGSAPGGVCLSAFWDTTPPPVNRMTNRCKNITLATTSLRPVTILHYINNRTLITVLWPCLRVTF